MEKLSEVPWRYLKIFSLSRNSNRTSRQRINMCLNFKNDYRIRYERDLIASPTFVVAYEDDTASQRQYFRLSFIIMYGRDLIASSIISSSGMAWILRHRASASTRISSSSPNHRATDALHTHRTRRRLGAPLHRFVAWKSRLPPFIPRCLSGLRQALT